MNDLSKSEKEDCYINDDNELKSSSVEAYSLHDGPSLGIPSSSHAAGISITHCISAGPDDVSLSEDTDIEFLSLQDISLEDISPEPARGDVYDSDTDSYTSLSLEDGEPGRVKRYLYQKSLVPSTEQLQSLDLKDGRNEVVFQVEGCEPISSQLFLWEEDTKIIVTDIEGVIAVSKPGVLGFFSSYSVHDGVTPLLSAVENNGYHLLYMASMSKSGTIAETKQLLEKLEGIETNVSLPAGPIFQSPDSLIKAFGAERTDIFKAAALRGVRSLFPSAHNPFYAGFGTSPSDWAAYSRCDVPEGRIFIVNNKSGEISTQNQHIKESFENLLTNVDRVFPDVRFRNNLTEDSYGDANYWKIPLPELDED